MTIRALPESMAFDLIPGLAAIEDSNVTEEFCFICSRCTDHRGEHSVAQLLALFDEIQRFDAIEVVEAEEFHYSRTSFDPFDGFPYPN